MVSTSSAEAGPLDVPPNPGSPQPLRPVAVVVVVVVLGVLMVAPVHSLMRFALFPQDEGLLLAYPSLILTGLHPNQHFESVYGATNLWILAGAFKVAGASVAVERAVGLAYRTVVIGAMVTLVLRRRGPTAAVLSGSAAIVMVCGTLGYAAFSWLAGLAFAALGLLLADLGLAGTERRWLVGGSGLCLGLVAGCRLDLGVASGLVVVTLLVVGLGPRTRAWLVGGFVAGLVPLLINVVQAGPAAVVRQQLWVPVFVTGPARRLPLATLGWQGELLLALCAAIGVALLISGIRSVRRDRSQWIGVLLVAIGLFDLALLPQVLQRSDIVHLALVGFWVLPSAALIPPLTAGVRTSETPGGRLLLGNAVPALVLVAVVVLGWSSTFLIYRQALPVIGQTPASFVVHHDGRSVPVASSQVQHDLRALLAAVDASTHAGQRLFVGPLDLTTASYGDTYLYFLLPDLRPATRYLEMDPGVANGKGSLLARELPTADVLILNEAYDRFAVAPGPAARGSSLPNAVVKRDFRAIGTYGTWTLYVHRFAQPTSAHGLSGRTPNAT